MTDEYDEPPAPVLSRRASTVASSPKNSPAPAPKATPVKSESISRTASQLEQTLRAKPAPTPETTAQPAALQLKESGAIVRCAADCTILRLIATGRQVRARRCGAARRQVCSAPTAVFLTCLQAAANRTGVRDGQRGLVRSRARATRHRRKQGAPRPNHQCCECCGSIAASTGGSSRSHSGFCGALRSNSRFVSCWRDGRRKRANNSGGHSAAVVPGPAKLSGAPQDHHGSGRAVSSRA